MRKILAVSLLLVGIVVFSGCTKDNIQLPNPAAVKCEEDGYIYEIREHENGGQYGVCIFDDGSECNGWAYFRGECGLDFECKEDDHCVPAQCCHPTSCVPRSQAPNCEGIDCTMECRGETMDCGQGSCVCVNGKCKVEWHTPDERYCETTDPKYCEEDDNCICTTSICFLGNKEYYNKCVLTQEEGMLIGCPDMCGFGPYEIDFRYLCESNQCIVASFNRTTGERLG